MISNPFASADPFATNQSAAYSPTNEAPDVTSNNSGSILDNVGSFFTKVSPMVTQGYEAYQTITQDEAQDIQASAVPQVTAQGVAPVSSGVGGIPTNYLMIGGGVLLTGLLLVVVFK